MSKLRNHSCLLSLGSPSPGVALAPPWSRGEKLVGLRGSSVWKIDTHQREGLFHLLQIWLAGAGCGDSWDRLVGKEAEPREEQAVLPNDELCSRRWDLGWRWARLWRTLQVASSTPRNREWDLTVCKIAYCQNYHDSVLHSKMQDLPSQPRNQTEGRRNGSLSSKSPGKGNSCTTFSSYITLGLMSYLRNQHEVKKIFLLPESFIIWAAMFKPFE